MKSKIYLAIDLKSFYASCECVSRGLDPLTTNLVVADASRTEKTICLAVSPSLKQYGIGGRCRLFEVNQKVRDVNAKRKKGFLRFDGNEAQWKVVDKFPGKARKGAVAFVMEDIREKVKIKCIIVIFGYMMERRIVGKLNLCLFHFQGNLGGMLSLLLLVVLHTSVQVSMMGIV